MCVMIVFPASCHPCVILIRLFSQFCFLVCLMVAVACAKIFNMTYMTSTVCRTARDTLM